MTTVRRSLLAVITAIIAVSFPAVANAQKQIEGYNYCGTKNFDTGAWHYGESDGAFLNAYARKMTCTDARRNVTRTKFTSTAPYRPYRTGYRCRTITSAHEYMSVRCVKIGGTRAYRFITGA